MDVEPPRSLVPKQCRGSTPNCPLAERVDYIPTAANSAESCTFGGVTTRT